MIELGIGLFILITIFIIAISNYIFEYYCQNYLLIVYDDEKKLAIIKKYFNNYHIKTIRNNKFNTHKLYILYINNYVDITSSISISNKMKRLKKKKKKVYSFNPYFDDYSENKCLLIEINDLNILMEKE